MICSFDRLGPANELWLWHPRVRRGRTGWMGFLKVISCLALITFYLFIIQGRLDGGRERVCRGDNQPVRATGWEHMSIAQLSDSSFMLFIPSLHVCGVLPPAEPCCGLIVFADKEREKFGSATLTHILRKTSRDYSVGGFVLPQVDKNFAPIKRHEVLCHMLRNLCNTTDADIPDECGSIGSHHSNLDRMYLPLSFCIPVHLNVSIKCGAKQGSMVGSYLSLPLHQINLHTRCHGHRVLAIVKGWHRLVLCCCICLPVQREKTSLLSPLGPKT